MIKSLIASIIFFTKIPIWKYFNIESKYFKNIVAYWSFCGLLTSFLIALLFYCFSIILPINISLILALIIRILLTGALHEDGLADFFDGFGGGKSKDRVLEIMKDSHIGTY